MMELDLLLALVSIGGAIAAATTLVPRLARAVWAAIVAPLAVNHSAHAAPVVMSRAAAIEAPDGAVSKDGRADARPDAPTWARADQVKLFTLLRAHGITRDEARDALRPFGCPVGNDVWAAAAPPPAPAAPDGDAIVTPFAGRVTSRKYYPDDPALEYKEPPVGVEG
jgi:hypothetical protein